VALQGANQMIALLKAIIRYPLTGGIDWNARLEADRQRRLASFELQDWRRRRAAALKGRGV
jgi:hypothetical protein